MGKKIEWLECIRGGAILLVVLGHLSLIGGGGTYSRFIYLFHMPLYFSISGFLYGYKEVGKKFDEKNFIYKKVISLGIPYLFFSVVYIIFNVSLQKYVHMNTQVNIMEIFSLFWKPVAHYWFLWVLVIYFVIVALVGKNRKGLIVLLLIGMAIALADGNGYKMLDPTYRKALIYFMFFIGASLLGERFKTEINMKANAFEKILLFIVSTVFFWLLALNIVCIEYQPLQEIFARIFGIVSFVGWIFLLKRYTVIQSILSVIGGYSWYIYLLHSYFLCAIRFLLTRMIPNGNPPIEMMLGMTCTVIGCIAIGKICKKVGWLDYIFYPYKLIKR